jgi:spermidine synthase
MAREAVQNTDVLYYAEGTESIVSVIKVKGGEQAFIANGTDEASSHMRARQVQLALGHLPMLLHDDPRDVLVIGLGSGMTAGATAVHPGVASVTVVEIEPRVLDVARTFEAYNHQVLDDPKVRTVLNDGRNFLLTTNRQFDVITADPPHPRFQGAGSLYASEYFALIARRLRPGGVVAERLPIYEMSAADLASVVKTFQQHFSHTMLWLAHDAVLVGRNDPFGIDEHAIDRRIDALSVAADLRELTMGSAADLLGYFVMGTAGMQALASGGVLNTDDRPYLEASAPFSDARPEVMAANAETITSHRESLLPDMKAASDPAERDAQENRWAAQVTAGRMGDRALVLSLGKGVADPDTMLALRRLTLEYPAYGPGRALWNEYEDTLAVEPRLLQETSLHLMGDDGGAVFVQIAAVLVPVSRTRAAVMFVDNRTRTVYGEAYMDDYDRDERASRFAADVMDAVSAVYQKLSAASQAQNGSLPAATAVMQSVTAIISSKVKSVQ